MYINKFTTLASNYLGIIIFSLVLVYILTELVNNHFLNLVVSILSLSFIFLSLPILKGPIVKIIYFLIILIIITMIESNNGISILLEGVTTNLPIISILALTPLLGITITTGDYNSIIRRILAKFDKNALSFYILFLISTHIFSIILNIGAVLINYNLMQIYKAPSNKIMANILNRGYTSMLNWSPYLGIIILVIDQLKIRWLELSSHAIGFVFLSFLVAILTDLKTIIIDEKRSRAIKFKENRLLYDKNNYSNKKVIELIILIFFPILFVLSLDTFTSINITLGIALVSIFFPLLWSVFKKKKESYNKKLIHHIKKTLPNLHTEFTLFLLAGVFGYSFTQSSLSDQSILLLNHLFGESKLFMSIAISIIVIFTAIVGIHPIVILSIMVISIVPHEISMSPLYFALLLLGSMSIANTISPATAVNNLLAYTIKEDIYTVSLKWNWKYSLVLLIVLILYLKLIRV